MVPQMQATTSYKDPSLIAYFNECRKMLVLQVTMLCGQQNQRELLGALNK